MCSLSHRVEACKNFRTVCSFVDLALSHLGHHKIRKFKSKRSNSSPFYFPKPRWFYSLFIWRVIGLSNDCNFVSFYFQMGGSVKNWKNFQTPFYRFGKMVRYIIIRIMLDYLLGFFTSSSSCSYYSKFN